VSEEKNTTGVNSSSWLDLSIVLGLIAGESTEQAEQTNSENEQSIESSFVSVDPSQTPTDTIPDTSTEIPTSSIDVSEPVVVSGPLSSDTSSEKERPDPAIDSDSDGLSDEVEATIGTNPTDPDTDDDGLNDGWEYSGTTPGGTKLQDADPLQKDLYITLAYAPSATHYSDEGIDDIRRSFAQMPVANPNGQSGIRTHVTTQTANITTSFKGNLSEFREKNGLNRSADVWAEGHHLIVVTPMQDAPEGLIGYGETPGRFAIARDGGNYKYGNFTVNAHIVTHELLHNIIGELDSEGGEIHTDNGWLSEVADKDHQSLSQTATNALNSDGIISLTD
jgi:hypothetical protein